MIITHDSYGCEVFLDVSIARRSTYPSLAYKGTRSFLGHLSHKDQSEWIQEFGQSPTSAGDEMRM